MLDNLLVPEINGSNLENAIKHYCDRLQELSVFRFLYNVEITDFLSQQLAEESYKIITETITNVIKHSKGTVIEVYVDIVENNLQILIEDNGMGFSENKVSKKSLGFTSIKNRTSFLQGELNIESRKYKGTKVSIKIPTS